MAYYDSHQYNHHHQPRHSRPSAGYAQDYYYPSGGSNGAHHPHPLDVVPRRDPSDESIEEIPRDYPPGEYYEYGTGYPPHPRRSRVSTVQEGVRRSHSMGGGRSSGYYDDSDYAHRSSRGRRSKHHDDRHYKYARSRSSSSSRSPPRNHRRRKSFSEQALGALGLGAAAAAGGSSRARERSRGRHSRSYSYSPSPTRSSRRHHRSDKDSGRVRDRSEQRIASAVKAAVTAGAVEAFRLRKDKGDWTGDKGKRILTAALSAGGTGGLVGNDPEKKSKRHLVESTLAGLATTHFINGPRSQSRSRSRHGRGKSKSRVEGLAATGALAAVGKQAWDAYQKRSRSQSRSRGRDRSPDDYGGKSSSRRQRSRSVGDYISRGMEALGLDSGPSKDKKSRDYPDEDDYRRRRRHRSSRYSDDDSTAFYSDDDRYGSDYGRRGSRRTRHSKDVGSHHHLPPPSTRPRTNTLPPYTYPHAGTAEGPRPKESKPDENSTDEPKEESEDEETIRNRQKKLTRETVLATGLATVATIHAAHGLHESVSQHRENAQRVRAGDMSEEEARRQKRRTNFSDAANIGAAVLGIKGVYGQWQQADEKRKQRADLVRECSRKRERARSRAQERRQQFREGLRRRASSHGDVPRNRTVYPDEVEEVDSFDHHRSGHYGGGYEPGHGYDRGFDRGRRESSWY